MPPVMHPTERLTILEHLSLFTILLRLPFNVLLTVILSPFLKQYKNKKTDRVATEASVRYFTSHVSLRQAQWVFGTTVNAYRKWTRSKGLQPIVEELGENAKLMWLTEKRTDRVLIYVHGGGFGVSPSEQMLSFCPQIHEELLRRDGTQDFGIVAVVYSLLPAQFPTQLHELTLALTHLFSSGLEQENAILLGDSAGGNLIVQLLAHALHPSEGVPPSPLRGIRKSSAADEKSSGLLGGVCLVSPWLSLDTPTFSHAKNDVFDIFPASFMLSWGKEYVNGIPRLHIPWIKPTVSNPDLKEPWFTGLDDYVGRMLISAGGKENVLDDATGLYDIFKALPSSDFDVQLDVEEDAIHDEPILFPLKSEGGLSDPTMRIVNWVGETFGF